MRRLFCSLFGHRFSPWSLVTAYFGREITKDACVRRCSCDLYVGDDGQIYL